MGTPLTSGRAGVSYPGRPDGARSRCRAHRGANLDGVADLVAAAVGDQHLDRAGRRLDDEHPRRDPDDPAGDDGVIARLARR